MRSIRVIIQRELGQYFTSPIAYLVAFAVIALTSWQFNADLANRAGRLPPDGAKVLEFFGFFTIFFAPIITMRLFAEEAREGTLELLLTMPVRDSDIVVGKYLSAWLYYSAVLALTLIYQIIWVAITDAREYQVAPSLDIGPVITAYLGVWLFGGAALAVTMLFSALTDNQIVAAFLGMAVLFILWLGDFAGQVVQNRAVAETIRELSLRAHFATAFLVGVVRFEDVAFFIALIVATVFITIRLVESQRWR